MASLVADYSDSDEETDEKFSTEQTSTAGTLYYEVDISDSSSDNDDDDEGNRRGAHEATSKINDADRTVRDRLPHPDFAAIGHGNIAKVAQQENSSSASSSVFANPFLAEEEAKNLALERHVKMTSNAKSQSRTINGRQVCWNYRKGRCRFGHNCKFAHDSDLSSESLSTIGERTREVNGFRDDAVINGDGEEEGETTNGKKRKKPGLSGTLVPPKRSMKAYKKQQHQEQPWLKS